jgi:methylthioribose-1-phosphate isomerase
VSSGSRSASSSTDDAPFQPVRWAGDALELIDQTRLPAEEVWLRCERPEQVADAIRRLAVRGAPAIGVAAAYGLALGLRESSGDRLDEVYDLLALTRPTAVNLRWALDRGLAAREGGYEALLEVAHEIAADQMRADRAMARHAAALFSEGDRALTHCNTGPLATAGFGTALGALNQAWTDGRLSHVWVDETRPLLQGARLTAWELGRLGIPFQVVPDATAGALMSRGLVDRIVVGADRIAANGDVANKIGTYTLAVLAQRHAIPFYVVAPLSTIDTATATGAAIPIEERDPGEVTPNGTPALNLAFDVTPAELVTAIITEAGVLEQPYNESIAAALRRTGR